MTGVWSKSTNTNTCTHSGNPHVSPEYLEIFRDGSIRWKAPPKILHRCLLASSASSAVGVVASGSWERCELERKKATFLFHFFFSSLRGRISPLAQHASPSHGEGVVCFCGQTALLGAGGRTNGREGLRSNGWLEKLELESKSWKQIPVKTNADQKYITSVFTCLWRIRMQTEKLQRCFLTLSALHGVWNWHKRARVCHSYPQS